LIGVAVIAASSAEVGVGVGLGEGDGVGDELGVGVGVDPFESWHELIISARQERATIFGRLRISVPLLATPVGRRARRSMASGPTGRSSKRARMSPDRLRLWRSKMTPGLPFEDEADFADRRRTRQRREDHLAATSPSESEGRAKSLATFVMPDLFRHPQCRKIEDSRMRGTVDPGNKSGVTECFATSF
jgi:hypothetical protein